jgi:hypothetical protein
MSEYTHIIERVNIEVDVQDISTANHIRDNVQQFLYGNVLPQLESMLNGVSTADEFYRAKSLSLEFSFDSKAQFDEKFSSQLLESLGRIITTELPSKTKSEKEETGKKEQFEKKSVGEKQWQVFVHFLANGTLPWFMPAGGHCLDENEILDFISTASINWKLSFYELIRDHPAATKRLLRQFSVHFIAAFISAYIEQDITVFEKLYNGNGEAPTTPELQRVEKIFLFGMLEYLLTVEAPATLSFTTLKEIASRIIEREKEAEANNDKELSPEKDVAEEEVSAEEKKEGIYVSQAGLILLHPFLQYFFDELGLLEKKQFKDAEARQTAVHLLHYLATGKEQPMEYEMLMEKYLCGSYIHESIERFIVLTDAMKQECEQLLQAVIGHWKALRSTSPDGLREGFLQRKGKLIVAERDQLVVEMQSFDVLLENLPWNYSIISLPWLNKELYVDWQAAI